MNLKATFSGEKLGQMEYTFERGPGETDAEIKVRANEWMDNLLVINEDSYDKKQPIVLEWVAS